MSRDINKEDSAYRAVVKLGPVIRQDGKIYAAAETQYFGPYTKVGVAKAMVSRYRTNSGHIRGNRSFVDGWVEVAGDWVRLED